MAFVTHLLTRRLKRLVYRGLDTTFILVVVVCRVWATFCYVDCDNGTLFSSLRCTDAFISRFAPRLRGLPVLGSTAFCCTFAGIYTGHFGVPRRVPVGYALRTFIYRGDAFLCVATLVPRSPVWYVVPPGLLVFTFADYSSAFYAAGPLRRLPAAAFTT